MANQLLSILESTLNGIAAAIKEKAGLSSSTKLSFPTGMVNTINAIETEANITPKITGKTDYLTTSKKSVPIDAGFHDGTGSVNIRLQSKSATPSASQQNITPDSGYFLSSVSVGGIGSRTRVYVGTKTVSSASDTMSISNLPFTPTGFICVMYDGQGGSKGNQAVFSKTKFGDSSSHYAGVGIGVTGYSAGATNANVTISGTTISAKKSTGKYYGKYLYVIWDGDP